MKQYLKIIIFSSLISLIAANISLWVFYGGWLFFPVPLGAGFLLVIIQKENKSYKFLGKLSVGSVFFGFLTALFAHIEMFFFANFVYQSGMPFWVFYNPKEYFMFSLVFVFISFLGGLLGIVVKGSYSLLKTKD